MKLTDLKPGDIIKYDYIVGVNDVVTGQGEITEITEQFITVRKRNSHFDKLEIRDIKRNMTRILGHKAGGEDSMSNLKEANQNKAEIMAEAKKIIKNGESVTGAARILNLPPSTLHTWLKQEKKRNQKFEKILDSVDAGKQKPGPDPQPVIKSAVYDFTEQDNDPIEHVPTHILEHHLICDEIAKLLDAKRHDYGTDNIKKFGSLGCLIRASDKVERLITLRDKPAKHKEDTWLDLAGYAVLGLIESRAGR